MDISASLQEIINPKNKNKSFLRFDLLNSFTKMITFRKGTTIIGIDIGPEHLRMIKTTRTALNIPVLLDYKSVPLPYETERFSTKFEDFLKSELSSFFNIKKRTGVWGIISTAHVNVSHIIIPKVEKAKLEKTVYWDIKRDRDFDENEYIYDFKIQKEIVDKDGAKLAIMVYFAPKKEVKKIEAQFSNIGIQLEGISIIPFGLENILQANWIHNPGRTNAILFIGTDFSRIDIYYSGNLVMTRDIKAGAKSKIDALIAAFNYRTRPFSEIVTKSAEIDDEQARKILISLSQDSHKLVEGDQGYGLKEEEIFEMILPALKRFVRQLKITFNYYERNVGIERVDKLYVSGVINIHKHVIEYLSGELGVKGGILDPLEAQIICKDLTLSERLSLVPSLGIALSDHSRMPNLLYTYKDRGKEAKVNRLNLIVFSSFILSALFCCLIFVYQRHIKVKNNVIIAGMERQLANSNPRLSKKMILQMVADVRQEQDISKSYIKRYNSLAIISEITSLMLPNIRIVNLRSYFGRVLSTDKTHNSKVKSINVKRKIREDGVELEGLVRGDAGTLEAKLLEYQMKLNSSPMLSQVIKTSSEIKSTKNGKVLIFFLNIKFESR